MARGGHGLVWAPEGRALDDLSDEGVVEVLRGWRCGEMRLSLVGHRHLVPERIKVVVDFLCATAKL